MAGLVEPATASTSPVGKRTVADVVSWFLSWSGLLLCEAGMDESYRDNGCPVQI